MGRTGRAGVDGVEEYKKVRRSFFLSFSPPASLPHTPLLHSLSLSFSTPSYPPTLVPSSPDSLSFLTSLNLTFSTFPPHPHLTMLRLSTFTLLLASSLSLSTALVVPKSFGTPHHSQDGLIILDLDAVVGSSSRSKHHTALLDASIDAAVGTTNYLVEIVADSTVASSHRKKLHPRSPTPTPSFLNADLDATLLSVEKGLVDATPTIKSGGTDLVGAVVKSGKGALIALDVLATVLGPQQVRLSPSPLESGY